MSSAKAKPSKAPASHPKYIDMITRAVKALGDKSGSSRQAINKYIVKEYKLTENNHHNAMLKQALKRGSGANGPLVHNKGKGAAGSFRIKPAQTKPAKPAAKKAKKAPAKKSAAKKAPAKKKTPAKPAKPAEPAAETPAAAPAPEKPAKTAKPKVAKEKSSKKSKAASPKKPKVVKAKKSPKKAKKGAPPKK